MSIEAVAARNPDLDWSDRAAVTKAMREHDEQQALAIEERRVAEQAEFDADAAARKAAEPAVEPEVKAEPAVAEAEAATIEVKAEAAPEVAVAAADAELADLTAQLEALRAENAELAKQVGAKAKSDTAAAREKILQKLVEHYGEDHVEVEAQKLRNTEMDRLESAFEDAEKAKAQAQTLAEDAEHQRTHDAAVKQTPFLKSVYDNITGWKDGKAQFKDKASKHYFDQAAAISRDLLVESPKLSEADHYKAVEKEMLEVFPAAKAQFYGSKPDPVKHPKVVSMNDLPGGKAPVTGAPRKGSYDDLMAAVLKDPSKSSLEHARALNMA